MHLAGPSADNSPLRVSTWRVFEWPVVWAVAAIAVVLGSFGFYEYAQESHESATVFEYVYRSLQLFVLHMPHMEHELNWKIETARLLAPAVSFYTATKTLIVLFRDQLQLLRLFFTSGHVVICGLSRKGNALAEDFRNRRHRVVAIEKNPTHEFIAKLKRRRVTVITGDATDPRALVRARVPWCRHVIAVCDDDGVNVEIAVRTAQLLQKWPRHSGNPISCYVHLVNRDLRELFRRENVLTDAEEPYDVNLFDIYTNNARILLRNHPLDRRPIGPKDSTRVHLVIMGFGQMGESLALHAARVAHFANGLKPRITVVDREADAKQKRFLHQYRQFQQACDIEFVHREVDDPEVAKKVHMWCEEPDSLPYFAICFDNDAQSLAAALRIRPELAGRDIPVLVRMSETTGLATLLAEAGSEPETFRNLHAFGMVNQTSTKEMVLNEELDRLAKAIHTDYVRRRTEEKPEDSGNPSLASWEKLDDSLKRSNRHQADHIGVKLRAVGCEAASKAAAHGRKAVTEFTPDEVELLARMEHARWNAERFLDGWTQGPKNVEQKTTPYLVDYADLPPEIQEYDREAVRNIPHLLSLVGEASYRNAPAEQPAGA